MIMNALCIDLCFQFTESKEISLPRPVKERYLETELSENHVLIF